MRGVLGPAVGLFALVSACRVPSPPSIEELCSCRAITDVALSEDGSMIAYVSDDTGHPDLYAGATEGGEVRRLTQRGETITGLQFSPDGRWLYAASDHGGDESFDIFRVPAEGGEIEWLLQSENTEQEPLLSPDGRTLAYLADVDTPWHTRLCVLDLKSRVSRCLVGEGDPVYGIAWSPDGRRLAVVQTPDDQRGDLLVVDLEGGTVLRTRPTFVSALLMPADFSPGGSAVLCLTSGPGGFQQMALVEGDTIRFIGPHDWDVVDAAWKPSIGILYVRNEDGVHVAYRMTSPDSKSERLTLPEGSVGHLKSSERGDRLVFLLGDTRRPPELWLHDMGGESRVRARSLAPSVSEESLSEGAMIRYLSSDGLEIPALLHLPVVERLGSPPPLIVDVHGGPCGQSEQEFMEDHQALTTAGFALLAPNYRGSTGYGRAYQDRNNKDWGGKDLEDIVAGVRHLADEGLIDPDRVGITGGSYGGYMTLLALVKRPDVWAAGVEMFGMPDLVYDYDISVDRFGTWYETEMGTPKTHPELFHERSAIHFLDRMRAPLLVLQGENDSNVPKEESDLIVEALRKRGHPVEYSVYPDEGHGFVKRETRVDAIRRTVEFFVRNVATGHGVSQ